MKNIIVNISSKEVTLQELQNDVAGAERKGYGYQFAFTLHTVQGLINKINELTENQNTYSGEFIEIHDIQIAVLYHKLDTDKKYPYPIHKADKDNAVIQSFSNQVDLDEYVKELNKNTSEESYLVLKNADFTEGRGPMLPHKLFKCIYQAEEYISKQDGIYGSKQNRYIATGVNIHEETYAYVVNNGYKIKTMKYEH